jgi:hypothetical protein
MHKPGKKSIVQQERPVANPISFVWTGDLL